MRAFFIAFTLHDACTRSQAWAWERTLWKLRFPTPETLLDQWIPLVPLRNGKPSPFQTLWDFLGAINYNGFSFPFPR